MDLATMSTSGLIVVNVLKMARTVYRPQRCSDASSPIVDCVGGTSRAKSAPCKTKKAIVEC